MPVLPRTDAELEAAAGDGRSADRLRHHYEVERRLAAKLREASAQERTTLYGEVYDEMYRLVPDHPLLTRGDSGQRDKKVDQEMRYLRGLVDADTTVLEVGAGDGALSRRLAERARHVHAVDVADEILRLTQAGGNLEAHVFDGLHFPLPDASIDLAYSNQLMEHLHPDDARTQLLDIARMLRPGGRYLCLTPNGITGPWDVSRYFTATPTGFHLHEYTHGELHDLMLSCGFRSTRALLPVGDRARTVPSAAMRVYESGLKALPSGVRSRLSDGPAGRPVELVRILAAR